MTHTEAYEDGIGATQELTTLRLDFIQEFWVGLNPADDSIRIIGSPAVLETHGSPCCLSGIRDDGELFCQPLAHITACIVHVGDRRRAFYFPKGVLQECRLEEVAE